MPALDNAPSLLPHPLMLAEEGVIPFGGPNAPTLKSGAMTCGEELKSYQTRRYLVLPEIALGLASSYIVWG